MNAPTNSSLPVFADLQSGSDYLAGLSLANPVEQWLVHLGHVKEKVLSLANFQVGRARNFGTRIF